MTTEHYVQQRIDWPPETSFSLPLSLVFYPTKVSVSRDVVRVIWPDTSHTEPSDTSTFTTIQNEKERVREGAHSVWSTSLGGSKSKGT